MTDECEHEAYAKACRPHKSKESAEAAASAFVDAVYRARKKYRIPDCTMAFTTIHLDAEGKAMCEPELFEFGEPRRNEALKAGLGMYALRRIMDGAS